MTNIDSFKQITAQMAETYERKNADYGNSFEETIKKWGPSIALARIDDKLNRVATLLKSEAQVKDESIEDTLMDMATYAIMTLIWLKKQSTTPVSKPVVYSEVKTNNFDYLIGKKVVIKGGINSNGFPNKKIFGTIVEVRPVKNAPCIEVIFNNVMNTRSQIVGSGTYSSQYPIDNLKEYGLDVETINKL